MIISFQHVGLKNFHETGSKKGIQPKHARRLRFQLAALNSTHEIEDINVPGFKLHKLKGSHKNIWSIWVNGNWRITFEFKDGHVYEINYEDYH